MSSLYFLFPFLYIFLLSVVEFFYNIKGRFFYFFIVFLLVLIAGLRYETGFDYQQYVSIYYAIIGNSLSFLSITSPVEIGYGFVNYLIYRVGGDYLFVFIIMAFLGIALKAYCFKRISPYPFLSLLFYYQSLYFSSDFAQIRQSVALSLVFFSFFFITKRKLIPFLITIFLASSFHVTALVFLFAYFIPKVEITKNKLILLIFFITFAFFIDFLKLNDVVPILISNIVPSGYLQAKIQGYLMDSEFGGALGFGFFDIVRIITALMCIFFLWRYTNHGNLNENYKLIFLLYVIGVIIYFSLKSNEIFATRISLYFKALDVFIYPYVILFFKTKNNHPISFLCFLILIVLSFFVFYVNSSGDEFSCYKTIITGNLCL
ncbi:EpsG family protein [Pectobacterium brasiliense]|uniref:EpsG family protein n=1 Tax=Pectobacterium brasiliense TaxID=180957 RepID=UPI003CF5EC60